MSKMTKADLADQYHDQRWNCPECGASNLDVMEKTAEPICRNCENEFDWGELDRAGAFTA